MSYPESGWIRDKAKTEEGPPATFIFCFPGGVAWDRPAVTARDGGACDTHSGRLLSWRKSRKHTGRLDWRHHRFGSRCSLAHRDSDANRSLAHRLRRDRHWLFCLAGPCSELIRLNPVRRADRHRHHGDHLSRAGSFFPGWAPVRPSRDHYSPAHLVTLSWLPLSTTIELPWSEPTVVQKKTPILG